MSENQKIKLNRVGNVGNFEVSPSLRLRHLWRPRPRLAVRFYDQGGVPIADAVTDHSARADELLRKVDRALTSRGCASAEVIDFRRKEKTSE